MEGRWGQENKQLKKQYYLKDAKLIVVNLQLWKIC